MDVCVVETSDADQLLVNSILFRHIIHTRDGEPFDATSIMTEKAS